MHWQALHRAPQCAGLIVDPGDSRSAYRQIADTLAEMIRSGQLRVGERLPSVREMSEGGVPTASARHALAVLTEEVHMEAMVDWHRTTAKPREIRARLTAVYKKHGLLHHAC